MAVNFWLSQPVPLPVIVNSEPLLRTFPVMVACLLPPTSDAVNTKVLSGLSVPESVAVCLIRSHDKLPAMVLSASTTTCQSIPGQVPDFGVERLYHWACTVLCALTGASGVAAMKAIMLVVITIARVVLVISLPSVISAKDTFEKSIRLANPLRPT